MSIRFKAIKKREPTTYPFLLWLSTALISFGSFESFYLAAQLPQTSLNEPMDFGPLFFPLIYAMLLIPLTGFIIKRNTTYKDVPDGWHFTGICIGLTLIFCMDVDSHTLLHRDVTHIKQHILARREFNQHKPVFNTTSVPIQLLKKDIRATLGGPKTIGAQLVLQDELELNYHMPYYLLNSILWQGKYLNQLEQAGFLHTVPKHMLIHTYTNIQSISDIQGIQRVSYGTYTAWNSSSKTRYSLMLDKIRYAERTNNGMLTSGFVPVKALLAYQKTRKAFGLPPFDFNAWLTKNSGRLGANAVFNKLTASLDKQNECIVKLGSMCPTTPHLAG
jgi:hypothetical protein